MIYVHFKYLLTTLCLLVVLSACGSSSTPDTHTLTISKAGSGSGRVTSTPTGIDCGADCTETYSSGSDVTLNAIPDNSSEFVSWGGDADCDDGLITLNSDVSCTAIFNFVCDVVLQDCPISTEACFLSLIPANTLCATPAITTPPGEQGDICGFINGCAAGYSCTLPNDPDNQTSLACALSCDAITPNTTCQAAGFGLTCVQVNQFYSNVPDVPDVVGMCVDCSVFTCP